MKGSVTCLLIVFFIACNTENISTNPEDDTIIGRWQLFERGYSPGDKYIVEDIASDPVQYIQFSSDSTFASNIDGYESFDRFSLGKEDGTPVLVLFGAQQNEVRNSRSFTISASVQRLELRARWCIEGCHEAFRPVSNTQNP